MNLARRPPLPGYSGRCVNPPCGTTTYTLRAHVPGLPTQVACYGDMTEISSQTFSYDGTAAYYRQQVASLLKKLRYSFIITPKLR